MLSTEIELYQARLQELAKSIDWCTHWGIAGLPEAVYTMLLGELLREQKWQITYEPSYRALVDKSDFKRGDLLAEKDGRILWIEARWWWKEPTIDPVLHDLGAKLQRIMNPEVTVAALVLTLGARPECKTVHPDWRWTVSGPRQDMIKVVSQQQEWQFWGCAIADSNFVLPGRGSPRAAEVVVDGQVAAAFYGLCR